MNFRKYIKDKKIVGMAPMDGFTDEAMRQLQTKICKPDVMFTEFISVEGMAHGASRLLPGLLYDKNERPIIAQLFGKDPRSFYKATVIVCYLGFDGVDINMGCPAKRVTQHGSGAALIEKPKLAIEIIAKCRQAIEDWTDKKIDIEKLGFKKKFLKELKSMSLDNKNKPTLSVKTRLGVETSLISDWIKILASQPIDILTLHGRTLKQGYAGKADWNEISKAARLAKSINKLLVFWGNGDIENKYEAKKFIKKYEVDGVLLGRASLGNPWIFGDEQRVIDNKEKFDTLFLHAQIFTKIFPKRDLDHLRSKFLAYTKGFRNAKKIRKKLIRVSKIEDLVKLEEDFLQV